MPTTPANSPGRSSSQAEPKHVPALDGLRGLAVLLVVGFHFVGNIEVSKDNIPVLWLHNVLSGGWIGVDIFFVLSGYLITRILYDSLASDHYFRNFYVRRFLRIFPLYYGYLFGALCFSKVLRLHWGVRMLYLLTYTQNFVLPRKDRVGGLTSHFWSLAIEEQFYLFWPLAVFIIKDRTKLLKTTLWLAGSAVALRFCLDVARMPGLVNYQFTLARLDSLGIGAGLALALRGGSWKTIHMLARPTLAACCIVLGFVARANGNLYFWESRFIGTAGYSLIALAGAALLVIALDRGSSARYIFENRMLRWLGTYSYGIYVLHMAVLNLFWLILPRLHFFGSSANWIHLPIALMALIDFLVTCAMAWLSYNLYEVHFLKLKRYFSYDRLPRQAAISE